MSNSIFTRNNQHKLLVRDLLQAIDLYLINFRAGCTLLEFSNLEYKQHSILIPGRNTYKTVILYLFLR